MNAQLLNIPRLYFQYTRYSADPIQTSALTDLLNDAQVTDVSFSLPVMGQTNYTQVYATSDTHANTIYVRLLRWTSVNWLTFDLVVRTLGFETSTA